MKQYKIIKATYPKLIGVIFEYAILKDMQPPKWFTNWSTEFEKRNNARFDRIENRLEKVEDRLDNLDNRVVKLETSIINLDSRVSNIDSRVSKLESIIVNRYVK